MIYEASDVENNKKKLMINEIPVMGQTNVATY